MTTNSAIASARPNAGLATAGCTYADRPGEVDRERWPTCRWRCSPMTLTPPASGTRWDCSCRLSTMTACPATTQPDARGRHRASASGKALLRNVSAARGISSDHHHAAARCGRSHHRVTCHRRDPSRRPDRPLTPGATPRQRTGRTQISRSWCNNVGNQLPFGPGCPDPEGERDQVASTSMPCMT